MGGTDLEKVYVSGKGDGEVCSVAMSVELEELRKHLAGRIITCLPCLVAGLIIVVSINNFASKYEIDHSASKYDGDGSMNAVISVMFAQRLSLLDLKRHRRQRSGTQMLLPRNAICDI